MSANTNGEPSRSRMCYGCFRVPSFCHSSSRLPGPGTRGVGRAGEGGFQDDPAAAALPASLVPGQVERLASRKEDQQPPQVVAVTQLREPARTSFGLGG